MARSEFYRRFDEKFESLMKTLAELALSLDAAKLCGDDVDEARATTR